MENEGGRHAGRVFVLSGPSGVGKDAALARMKELGRPYHFTVTSTTRGMRPGERDGVDYVFISRERFERMIARGEFLEWAEVYGNLYGVPKRQVTDALEHGQHVILKIDVQGAATVREMYPDATLIFLEPPDMGALEHRLRARNTESGEALRLKLETARAEMGEAARYDYRVVNTDGMLDEAVAAIDGIVSREATRAG